MDTQDLQFIDQIKIYLGGNDVKIVLTLQCSSKEIADKLHSILLVNLFKLDVRISPQGVYSVEIVFTEHEDLVLGINTGYTKDEYPPLQFLSNQQVNFITTGYRDDQGNLQLIEPHKSLENLIHLN